MSEEPSTREGKAANGQLYTLFQKSLSFQKRQRKIMCCVICFPTIFIVAVALLGALGILVFYNPPPPNPDINSSTKRVL